MSIRLVAPTNHSFSLIGALDLATAGVMDHDRDPSEVAALNVMSDDLEVVSFDEPAAELRVVGSEKTVEVFGSGKTWVISGLDFSDTPWG